MPSNSGWLAGETRKIRFNSTVNPVLDAAEQVFDLLAAPLRTQHLHRGLPRESSVGALHPPRRLLGVSEYLDRSSEDRRERLRRHGLQVPLSLEQFIEHECELLASYAELLIFF